MMVQWFKSLVLPHTKGQCSLLIIDSFSTHEDAKFLDLAHANNVDVAIIQEATQANSMSH